MKRLIILFGLLALITMQVQHVVAKATKANPLDVQLSSEAIDGSLSDDVMWYTISDRDFYYCRRLDYEDLNSLDPIIDSKKVLDKQLDDGSILIGVIVDPLETWQKILTAPEYEDYDGFGTHTYLPIYDKIEGITKDNIAELSISDLVSLIGYHRDRLIKRVETIRKIRYNHGGGDFLKIGKEIFESWDTEFKKLAYWSFVVPTGETVSKKNLNFALLNASNGKYLGITYPKPYYSSTIDTRFHFVSGGYLTAHIYVAENESSLLNNVSVNQVMTQGDLVQNIEDQKLESLRTFVVNRIRAKEEQRESMINNPQFAFLPKDLIHTEDYFFRVKGKYGRVLKSKKSTIEEDQNKLNNYIHKKDDLRYFTISHNDDYLAYNPETGEANIQTIKSFSFEDSDDFFFWALVGDASKDKFKLYNLGAKAFFLLKADGKGHYILTKANDEEAAFNFELRNTNQHNDLVISFFHFLFLNYEGHFVANATPTMVQSQYTFGKPFLETELQSLKSERRAEIAKEEEQLNQQIKQWVGSWKVNGKHGGYNLSGTITIGQDHTITGNIRMYGSRMVRLLTRNETRTLDVTFPIYAEWSKPYDKESWANGSRIGNKLGLKGDGIMLKDNSVTKVSYKINGKTMPQDAAAEEYLATMKALLWNAEFINDGTPHLMDITSFSLFQLDMTR